MNIKTKIETIMPKIIYLAEKASVIVEKGHNHIKDYVAQEENIKHISLMIYNTLPLAVRLGVKQEQFYEKFKVVFELVRNELFDYPTIDIKKLSEDTNKVTISEEKPKKTRVKKTVKKDTSAASKAKKTITKGKTNV